MRRRTLLQLLGSLVACLPFPIRLRGQAVHLEPEHEAAIRALAEVVLPSELGAEVRQTVVTGFLAWVRDYRADADMGHGYGFTRLRRTAPGPAARYGPQLQALDQAARGRATHFAELSVAERRPIVEAAIASAKIERLPVRPDGGHVATDLMAFYFQSTEANDLCYRARIGRDICRGLDGSERKPAPLTPGGR